MRIFERLDELYAMGDRIGYSAEEQRAHELAAGWFVDAGLEVEVDDAGNLLGRIPGGSRAIWTGSHLDTVPSGGRFDGALGVVAGLEAVERIGLPGLGVVVFRDEERGCAGSRARVASGSLPDAFVELHIEQGPRLEELWGAACRRAWDRRLRPVDGHCCRACRPRGNDADGRS